MTYIKRFKEHGVEDHETREALKFMDSFYKYDHMRETDKIKGTGARPDMKLAGQFKDEVSNKLKDILQNKAEETSSSSNRINNPDGYRRRMRSAQQGKVREPRIPRDNSKSVKSFTGKQKAAIGAGLTAAVLGTSYAAHKLRKKKQEVEIDDHA